MQKHSEGIFKNKNKNNFWHACDLCVIGERAKRVKHYQGCTNSSWCGTYIYIKVRVKKFVPNKKGDIGMEVHYVCQPNTYVIAREFGEQQ